MSKYTTEPQIRQLLADKIGFKFSQRDLAAEIGCSASYLNEFLHGKKGVSEEILCYLNLKRVFVKANKRDKQ